MIEFFKTRFFQGSTHAGFAAAMQAAKFFFPQYAGIFDAATGLFSAVAIAVNN